MPEESYLLVSLKEEESKKLAQVISNSTSRKILDYLSTVKDATESDIAKKMGLPISTVHYNLSHLVKANLVQVDEFHYSDKGKEVNHYKLSNKMIIIAPTGIDKVKDRLKSLLPVALIAAVAGGFIHFLNSFIGNSQLAAETAPKLIVADEAPEAARIMTDTAPQAAETVRQAEPSIALWFLIGAFFVLLVIFIWELVRKMRKS